MRIKKIMIKATTLKGLVSILCILSITGCSTRHLFIAQNNQLNSYKTAYIVPLKKDTFNLNQQVPLKLRKEFGYNVKMISPLFIQANKQDFKESDLIAMYSYNQRWDLSPYMFSVQVTLTAAKSQRILATSSYYLFGKWTSDKYRVDTIFNQIKEALTKPTKPIKPIKPTK